MDRNYKTCYVPRYDHNRSRPINRANKDSTASGGAARTTKSDSSPLRKDKVLPGAVKVPSLASLKEAEPVKSCMVLLGKEEEQKKVSVPPSVAKAPEEWVKAKEFVPGQFYVGSGKAVWGRLVSKIQT